jgi:hypothetical protein
LLVSTAEVPGLHALTALAKGSSQSFHRRGDDILSLFTPDEFIDKALGTEQRLS